VIPCGYDPTVFFPADIKSAGPSILFVGDLGTRKRGDLLLEVFARVVRATVPTAELWMVTTERVAAPGVRWFGRVPTTTLVELYQQAWVFCLPSLYEGFGVPYLEAMACGTPVVATLNGGAEEVLEAGAAGRIVAEGEIGPEIVRLLADSSARQALANLGLARVGRYAISQIATQYEALYREIAERS
jgi:glycosyltransferase involved in cell wall biosynthesis